jgi:hypothetical protein
MAMSNDDHGHNSTKRSEPKIQFTEVLQKIVEYLQSQPLLLFILGAAIILAAASAWAGQNLMTLSFALILLIIAGLVTWVFLEIRNNPDSHLRRKYGITFEKPASEYRVEKITVTGKYKTRPPDNLLRLFTISTDGTRCWPQTEAKIKSNGEWEGVVYLGGKKPDYDIKIVAAIVGRSTQILWKYYKNVGNVMKDVAPNATRAVIEGWPPDAVIQDTIYVKRVFDWDQESIFDEMKRKVGPKELEIAQRIFDWMSKDGRAMIYGDGQSGSVYPLLRPNGIKINPVYLSTDGKVWLQFSTLEGKPIFGPLEKRRELMTRLGAIKGVDLVEGDLKRIPSIALSKIAADPDGLSKLLSALNWMDEQIADPGQRSHANNADMSRDKASS